MQSERTAYGKSKVEQFKWRIFGKPGRLDYLPKNLLRVSIDYQRHLTESRALRMAANWDWRSCGALSVAVRDGAYYVVDGQHRLQAALKRDDIQTLPCVVFDSDGIVSEADAFYSANKERRPITTFEQWKARLVAEDPHVIYVNGLIAGAGRTPSAVASPTTVRCLSAILEAACQHRKHLEAIWPMVVQICEGRVLHERIFGAMLHLERTLIPGQSLADRHWRQKMVSMGYQDILDAIQRASSFYAKGGAKVWAAGLLQELNKRARTNLLEVQESKGV